MNLPINEKELKTILNAMRFSGDAALYQKMWRYYTEHFVSVEQTNEVKNGLS
jgi:hypothetical protein